MTDLTITLSIDVTVEDGIDHEDAAEALRLAASRIVIKGVDVLSADIEDIEDK